MKKILFIVAALFIVNSVFSQDVKFGVKVGANAASLSGIETSYMSINMKMFEPDGMSIGYHGGLFANIGFGKLLGFQPEVLFSMQGGKHKASALFGEFDDELGNAKMSYKLGYISVPLLLEVKPVANLGILVGPQFGYNVTRSATAEYDGEKETISGKDFDEDFMELQKFDVGVAMGLQYSITDNLHIGARYYLGLMYGIDESEDGATVKGFKNGVIQVSLGFSF